MMEALMSLTMPCSWIYNLARDHPVRVLLIDTVKTDDGITKDLVEINLREEDADGVIETIHNFERVVGVEITERHKGRLLAIVEITDCPGCEALATADVFLLSAHTTEDKRIEWKVAFSNREDLDKLVWELQQTGTEVELVRSPSSGATTIIPSASPSGSLPASSASAPPQSPRSSAGASGR
jgi:predicted DNA binding protein